MTHHCMTHPCPAPGRTRRGSVSLCLCVSVGRVQIQKLVPGSAQAEDGIAMCDKNMASVLVDATTETIKRARRPTDQVRQLRHHFGPV